MKIGYPCINNSIPHNAPSTFRLAFYSKSMMIQTVKDNIFHLNQHQLKANREEMKRAQESREIQERYQFNQSILD